MKEWRWRNGGRLYRILIGGNLGLDLDRGWWWWWWCYIIGWWVVVCENWYDFFIFMLKFDILIIIDMLMWFKILV